ncbi:polymeric immunoglobulin receptor-like [Channa argus]|uniref:polymeric immunoglobulin receptor-like n=1 Tax=Channa argus TaxID=215402 RepID=UPI00351FEBDE
MAPPRWNSPRKEMDYGQAFKENGCCDSSTKVQSYEGGSVSISCPYDSQYQNNLKSICRGNQPSTCLQQAAVTSDKGRNGQFSLTDDRSTSFTVTITSVTQKDSGSYLCGVQRNTGLDVFSAIDLEVKEWCCVKSNQLSGTVGHPLTMQCPYPPQHKTNRKFLCKGDSHRNCTDMVMSSSSSNQTEHRFTLQDDISSSSFSVTIKELKAEDAGTYWCGSDSQWRAGNYSKIQLSVGAEDNQMNTTEVKQNSFLDDVREKNIAVTVWDRMNIIHMILLLVWLKM